MLSPITELRACALDVPMTKPFGIAGGAQELARNVVVEIVFDDGVVGWGEGAPFPAFNGETQASTLIAIDVVRDALVGLRDFDDVADVLARAIPGAGAARCAIELAVLDAIDRRLGRRLFDAPPIAIETDVTIPIGPLDVCAVDARDWSARGFRRLKLKIGGAGFAEALDRTLAIHAAAPDASLILDGNAGLSSDDAVALLHALRSRGVVPILFEQPCAKDDIAGLFAVARASSVPVALDESASTVADLEPFAGAEAHRFVVNVKPMKAGFREAARIVEAAKARGFGLMIGGMVEGRMAMGASACFVAHHGGAEAFAFVDLDTPLFLTEEPFDGGYAQRGAWLDLATIDVGHGCRPRASR